MTSQPSMQAVVSDRYGPPEVLHLVEVPRPSPGPDEARVRILASAVTASDIFIRSGHVTPMLQIPFRLMIGVTKPRHPILGFVFSGVIDEVGDQIHRFSPGDEVYGMTGFRLGAYAQYRCMIETDTRRHGWLARKPANLTHDEATAAIYGGSLAVQYVDQAALRPGDDLLLYGASGTSGTIAVQYAKSLGAHVTGVCSTHNLDLVASLGADDVLDYTRVQTPPPGAHYAVMLDSVGRLKSSKLKTACRQALAPGGRYVSIDDGDLQPSSQRLDRLTTLIETGTLTPVLGKTYPLGEIVEAHRFVEGGHKRGGVAITIG